jgi:hypothetical protein
MGISKGTGNAKRRRKIKMIFVVFLLFVSFSFLLKDRKLEELPGNSVIMTGSGGLKFLNSIEDINGGNLNFISTALFLEIFFVGKCKNLLAKIQVDITLLEAPTVFII